MQRCLALYINRCNFSNAWVHGSRITTPCLLLLWWAEVGPHPSSVHLSSSWCQKWRRHGYTGCARGLINSKWVWRLIVVYRLCRLVTIKAAPLQQGDTHCKQSPRWMYIKCAVSWTPSESKKLYKSVCISNFFLLLCSTASWFMLYCILQTFLVSVWQYLQNT